MIERRHCSFLQVIEQSSRMFGSMLFAVILIVFSIFDNAEYADFDIDAAAAAAMGSGQAGHIALMVACGILGLIAICALLVWLRWKCTWVSAENDVLLYESGVLSKRKVSIPFAKINTIDMGRNIFERIFSVCRLKIDTGAISGTDDSHSELDLVFRDSEAEMIRGYILSRSAKDEGTLRAAGQSQLTVQSEPKWVFRANFGDFFLYGLTSSSVTRLFALLVGVILFISQLSTTVLQKIGEFLMPYAVSAYDTVSRFSIISILIYALLMFFFIFVIANIWSIVVACIKFYGFRAAREGDSVVIRYGLINLKSYTLPVRNVHAVTVRQNLLQQLLGRCSVEMVSVGYGNEKTENSLLFPIIRRADLDAMLAEVMPEYKLDVPVKKPDKRSIRFIILRPIFWTSLLFVGGWFLLSMLFESMKLYVIFAAFIELIVIVASILSYLHAGIGWNKNAVAVSFGGMRRSVSYIRTDAVQSVASSSGIFQRRHGIATYRIDYHAPAMRSIAIVSHMPDGFTEDIAKTVDEAKVF